MRSWNEIVDVIVVGSGAAGVSAAIAAQHGGAEALVLERSDKYGGTSAVSGGVPWIPNNHHMHEVGVSDSRDAALTYLKALSTGGMDMDLAEVYVDEAPGVLRYIEENTELVFRSLKTPDYHPEHPGGTIGRSVSPALFPANELGEMRSQLRPAPCFPIPVTMADMDDGIDLLDPAIVGERLSKGLVGTGMALMAGLIKGAVDKGVQFRRNIRILRLVLEDGTVVGVEGEGPDGPVAIGARRAVILASGGFEWNPELVQENLRGPLEGPLSPPFNEGDGLIMAGEVGARIANSHEAWWMPMFKIPGDEYEGVQLNRLTVGERASPHSIMVNRKGKRFVNEAHNYSDVGRTMQNFDPVAFDHPNLPAYIIVDSDFMERYPFATRFPGDPIPAWLTSASTLQELAAKIEVDANGLEETVARFNIDAEAGRDTEFSRGESVYDRYYGDPTRDGTSKNLGPIARAPFYAARVYCGALGTKGGPKISAKAEVLNVRGGRIPGLYAAGNVSAGFTGMAYPGAGGTLGPGMVFGHIAGREAASSINRF